MSYSGSWAGGFPCPGPSPHRSVLEEMKGTRLKPTPVPSVLMGWGQDVKGWMEDLGILDFPFSAGLRTRGSCAKSHGVVQPYIHQHGMMLGTTCQL